MFCSTFSAAVERNDKFRNECEASGEIKVRAEFSRPRYFSHRAPQRGVRDDDLRGIIITAGAYRSSPRSRAYYERWLCCRH